MFKRPLKVILHALLISAVLPLQAFASSELLFSPARGSYSVDEPISVKILVQSTEKLSGIEASAEFDPKVLGVEIQNVSNTVSWVITPSVDREKGLITFSGIMPKDTGLNAELLELSVTPLRPGNPELRFLSGASTVASDGTGGNTLGKITHAAFDILTQEDFGREGGEVLGASDTELIINSPDVQDETGWHALSDIVFNWTLPSGVKDVLVGLTKKQEDVGYKPAPSGTTTRTITGIEEGEWYFHVTPKGKGLDETKHFRIAIDNEAPEIGTTTEKERLDLKDPAVKYNIEATDKVSGVSHFEMILDGGPSNRWEDDGSHEYTVLSGGPGTHDLTIAAFDKANNRSEAHVNFNIEALPSPSIKLKRNSVGEASPIVAEILGLPNASAVITFEGGVVHHEDTLNLDGNGRAAYILKESVLPGSYQLSAVQKLSNGASSVKEVYVEIEVKPSIIGYLGRNLALSIALVPIFLLFVFYVLWKLGIVAWYFKRKLNSKVIMKVAPLSLMPPSNNSRTKQVEYSPLLIKRVVKAQGPNSVIDLRKR